MIPVDFGPKSIFSSKDAANWRKSVDSFFVGKTSYYMVTPATSFCDADSNLEKLVGGGMVCKSERNPYQKLFFFFLGTFVAYETSAGLFPTDYLRPDFFGSAQDARSALVAGGTFSSAGGGCGKRRCGGNPLRAR